MNKLFASAVSLALALSFNAFAAPVPATGHLSGSITVDGNAYTVQSQYTATDATHTFSNGINVGGTQYPAGTQWSAVQMANGTWVPVGSTPIAVPAAVGAGMAVSTTGLLVGIGALAVVAIANGSSSSGTVVTQ